MIQVTCYPMEPDSILITVQRGWDGNEVFDYLSKQNIIKELSWNDEKVNPSEMAKDQL